MAQPEKVLPLTSLRFFAAVAIVFHHYFGASFPFAVHNRWVAPINDYSAVAVFFFFMLSGYILSYVYLRGKSILDRKRFWVSRLARIYPLYIVTILFSVPHLLTARRQHFSAARAYLGTAATFITHALLLQHWIPQLGALNYPSWSISAEAFFYLVFPWLGVYLWRRSTQQAIALGTLWFVISWSVIVIGADWPRFNIVPHAMPLFELNLFVLGIVLGKVHFAIKQNPQRNQRLRNWGATLGVAALLALFAFTEWKASIPFFPIHDAMAAILFLILILAFASGSPFLEKLFTPTWLVVLGESSYGLYLIHAPLYAFLLGCGLHPSHVFFLLYLCGAIALSIVSFYFFETPARKRILRYFHTCSREPR